MGIRELALGAWARLFPKRAAVYRGSRGVGQRWEALAEKKLRVAGYMIHERNFRTRAGEIDLIAEENGVLCFVEVKGKKGPKFGAPAEAVTLEKRRRITRAAELYLFRRRLGPTRCRFDVVSIVESPTGVVVEIFRGAFEAPHEELRRR